MTLATFLIDMLAGFVIGMTLLGVVWVCWLEHKERHWGRCLILDIETLHYVQKIQRENERRRQMDVLSA